MTSSVIIRPAKQEDCAGIVDLIKELAEFEGMPEEADLTADDLVRDGFSTVPPLFHCIVAELFGKTIGIALYYYKYSTWKGRCIYLEDLYVTPELRNKDVGSKLFLAICQVALDEKCARLDFQVLSWNPATNFYMRKGAIDITESEKWHSYRMDRETLNKFVKESTSNQ